MKTLLTLLILGTCALAQVETPTFVNGDKPAQNLSAENLAVQGYDVVAYFTQEKAVKGNKDIQVMHKGGVYYFASKANKAEFQKTPERFLPAFGGWCAYGVGFYAEKGKAGKYPIDPNTFKIVNDKLYLYYNSGSYNALSHWNKDEAKLDSVAQKNWQRMTAED